MRLCYKARNSNWLERWQFTVAVCLEAIITLLANFLRLVISIYSTVSDSTTFDLPYPHISLHAIAVGHKGRQHSETSRNSNVSGY